MSGKVGAGMRGSVPAIARGEPPRAPRPGGGGPARRSRWPGFLLALLGVAGLALIASGMRSGEAAGWSKQALQLLSRLLGEAPWAAAVAADLARLSRPTLLGLAALLLVLGRLARRGVVAAILAAAALAVGVGAAMALAETMGAAGVFGALAGPEGALAAGFLVVLFWGWLAPWRVPGLLIGMAASVARVAIGEAAPMEAAAGAAAAVALVGMAGWVAPGRR